jgi:hypothetical protein
VHNFDETSFTMGLITGSGSRKAATAADHVSRVTITQPGSRKRTTAIGVINALAY